MCQQSQYITVSTATVINHVATSSNSNSQVDIYSYINLIITGTTYQQFNNKYNRVLIGT